MGTATERGRLPMRRRPRKLKLKRASKRRTKSDLPSDNEKGGGLAAGEQQRKETRAHRAKAHSNASEGIHMVSRFHNNSSQPVSDGEVEAGASGRVSLALNVPDINALQNKSELALAQLRASAAEGLNSKPKREKAKDGRTKAPRRSRFASWRNLARRRNKKEGAEKDGNDDEDLKSVRQEFGDLSDAMTPKGKSVDFLYIVGGSKKEKDAKQAASSVAPHENGGENEVEISKANFLFVVGSPARQTMEERATKHRKRVLLERFFRAWQVFMCDIGEAMLKDEEEGSEEDQGEQGQTGEDVEREREDDGAAHKIIMDEKRKPEKATLSFNDINSGKITLTIDTSLGNTVEVLQKLGIVKRQENAAHIEKKGANKGGTNEDGEENVCETPKKAAQVPLRPTILSRFYVDRPTGAERVQRWPGKLRSYSRSHSHRTRSLSPKRRQRRHRTRSLSPTQGSVRVNGRTGCSSGVVRMKARQPRRYRPRDFVSWEAHDSRRYNTDDKTRAEEARKGFRNFFPAPSSSFGAQRPVPSGDQEESMLQAMGLVPRVQQHASGVNKNCEVESAEGTLAKLQPGSEQDIVARQSANVGQNKVEGKASEGHEKESQEVLQLSRDYANDAEISIQAEAEREAMVDFRANLRKPLAEETDAFVSEPGPKEDEDIDKQHETANIDVDMPIEISGIHRDDAKAWFQASTREAGRQVSLLLRHCWQKIPGFDEIG